MRMTATDQDWTKPAAMAIPKEGYFEEERGRYGPVFPRTPACYGFSIIAKVKEGREEAVRAYGRTIEETIADSPEVLAPLKLHYLRWHALRHRSGLHFQYQGIFDTDFDKYTEDAVQLFSADRHHHDLRPNLEGFPEDWKENPDGVHQVRPRAPGAQLPRIRRISLRDRRRDQEGAAVEGGLLGNARPDAVTPRRCLNSTTSSTSC